MYKVAAVQMDANPAATETRIKRAETLVTQAAQAGAQLVVLPELFNTGYQYDPANHALAEPMNGRTTTWMQNTAHRLNIHLAGSLMLLDGNEVYNALLLVAPDGRFWRYDKNYPWGWERGYFRDANRTVIAHTDLGDFGLLICWDAAHRDLWQQYAGQVDMMIIASCPPNVSNPTYLFPNGERVSVEEMGPVMGRIKGDGRRVFGDMINQQTAWLGVPAVNTVGCGQITTAIPRGLGSLLTIVPIAPQLAKYLPQAGQMQMTCQMVQGCKVVAGDGRVLSELAQADGETFTMAEIILPDRKTQPHGRQPAAPISPLSYLASDYLLPILTTPVYREGLRQTYGPHMAPVNAPSRRWLMLLAVVGGLAYLLGRATRPSRR
jgi:hypothetical protein